MLRMPKFRIRPSMISGFLVMSLLLVLLGIISMYFAGRMQKNTRRILEENVTSLKAAEELEIALMDMKGITSNYLLRRNQRQLDLFQEKKAAFLYWLAEAKRRTFTPEEVQIVASIERLFEDYLASHERVVQHAREGNPAFAYEELTLRMLFLFDRIYEKCEELLAINEKLMFNTSALVERDHQTMNRLVAAMAVAGILSGIGLGLVLSQKILSPIHALVLRLRGASTHELVQQVDIASELEHLDEYVHRLINKVNEVNRDLELNQMMLMRTEKLAALGRMAAGLAHEIRNPLTAVKMLMYSLQEQETGSPQREQDMRVIISELDRIEKFLQDFLNFARPSQPRLVPCNPSDLFRQTLRLLSPQIKSKGIHVDLGGDPKAMIFFFF